MPDPNAPLRALLVRPPGRFASPRFPDGPMVGPPRALLHLAAAVRGDPGVEVRILDALLPDDPAACAAAEPPLLFGLEPEEAAARAAAWAPDLVGVTVMAAYYRAEAIALARALRAALPGAFLVFGGPDPTVDAAAYLAEAPIDAVCVGEGEATFAALCEALRAGLPWREVAGLAWKGEAGLARSAPRPALDDLENTVPDYDLVDLPRYFELAARGFRARPAAPHPGVERSVDVITSRGCPFRCSFCVIHTTMGRRFRTRSIDSVIDELRGLVARGVAHVHFEDDVINLDRRRFRDLVQAIAEAGLPLTWDTPNGLRADLLDATTARLCREAGCTSLIFGLESGSQRVLDEVIDKEMRAEAVVEAARHCAEAELDALAFTIVGLPGETLDEARETVELGFDLLRRYGTTPVLQLWRPYVQTTAFDRAVSVRPLDAAGRLALHRATGLPYSQLHHHEVVGGALTAAELAPLYAEYGRRLAEEQLARWRRAGVAPPIPSADPEAVQAFLLHHAPYMHAHRRGALVHAHPHGALVPGHGRGARVPGQRRGTLVPAPGRAESGPTDR